MERKGRTLHVAWGVSGDISPFEILVQISGKRGEYTTPFPLLKYGVDRQFISMQVYTSYSLATTAPGQWDSWTLPPVMGESSSFCPGKVRSIASLLSLSLFIPLLIRFLLTSPPPPLSWSLFVSLPLSSLSLRSYCSRHHRLTHGADPPPHAQRRRH